MTRTTCGRYMLECMEDWMGNIASLLGCSSGDFVLIMQITWIPTSLSENWAFV